ncbi:hypothetical protein JVT61DRAFT_10087 [Boletus reticuloceps]|uniref:Uncharacterized protein n=1 Tax=Boletus reticuloceps TaxID=495285 RepID=A0A8I2YZQ1_9AGAM|nr:hypothetical protein JVT61DRAFT_10087 [Boletus reticuloceps]
MKIFVAVLWALDTVHEALTVAGVYKYIIAGLINPSALLYTNPELPVHFLIAVLGIMLTSSSYSYSPWYSLIPCV